MVSLRHLENSKSSRVPLGRDSTLSGPNCMARLAMRWVTASSCRLLTMPPSVISVKLMKRVNSRAAPPTLSMAAAHYWALSMS
eukprot:1411933-Pyramimonas_sp.AAC.2